jgi:cysteinyl-tRNA synthetase
MCGHYRMPLNFTLEGLDAAKSSLQRIDSFIDRLKNQSSNHSMGMLDISEFIRAFEEALLDDLNTPLALSALFEMIRFVNAKIDQDSLSQKVRLDILQSLEKFDEVLGFIFHQGPKIPHYVMDLAEKRKIAKAQKHFSESDRLRDEIRSHGFLIEDTPQGYRVTPL